MGNSTKLAATEDAKEATIVEEYKQWERDAYRIGAEIARRTIGTVERHKANFAKLGYSFEIDPRFNGEHEAFGYGCGGDDPCDPCNYRACLEASSVPKPLVRLGRAMRRKLN